MASKAKGYLLTPVWYDSTDDEVKPLVNDDGQIPVSLAEAGDSIDVNIHGYSGTAWQKLGFVWGYSDSKLLSDKKENVAAGSYILTLGPVPAGEVWKIGGVATRCSTANPSAVDMYIYRETTGYYFYYSVTIVAWVFHILQLDLTLKEGDTVKATWWNCLLNDDIYLNGWGYSMKVTM